MVEPLTEDLIARIRKRAEDPDTRTDAPPALRGKSVTVGPLTIGSMDLGKMLRGDPDPRPEVDDAPLPARLEDAAIRAAESKLGFAVPTPLAQLYKDIGDGGFGPSPGLMSLQESISTYLELTRTPPGPRGQTWPPHLLPITRGDPGHDCIDINSGAVIFWDEEELADGVSDKVWKRSFKKQADSLGAWLAHWVDSKTPEQAAKDSMEKAMLDGLRQTLAYWRAKTPQERADFGLPETGWEQTLFGHLGIDLSKL